MKDRKLGFLAVFLKWDQADVMDVINSLSIMDKTSKSNILNLSRSDECMSEATC